MSYGQSQPDDLGEPNQMDLVPRWFEMLKELRNGTISYIQLIKREQIRPPVRPVCRRLGVAKLSDIVSEEILYRAIVQVAEAQGRSPRRDDNQGIDPIMGNAMDLMTQQGIPGIPGSHSLHSNVPGKYRHSFDGIKGVSFDGLTSRGIERDRINFNSTDIDEDYDPMAGYEPSGMPGMSHQSGMGGYDQNGTKNISPLQTSRSTLQISPASEREKTTFMGLLKAIMAVCAADGKILRLPQLTRDACMSEEAFISALQRICDIIGCYRLTANISQDVIMQAVNIFLDSYVETNTSQSYNRMSTLGMRTDADSYSRGPTGGQWPGQGGSNAQPQRGLTPGQGPGQRSSFNFDSYEGNVNNRGSFNPGQGGSSQISGSGPGFGLRQYPNEGRMNPNSNPYGGSMSGRQGYAHDMPISDDVLNSLNMNSAPSSSRISNGNGSGLGSGGVSFSVPDGNLSARIARASFPAATSGHSSLQQDMARLQQQQLDFPSQTGGGSRMPNMSSRIISPRLPPTMDERKESDAHMSQPAQGQGQGGQGQQQGSSLNVQSSPFYPTQPSINNANLAVIKNNAAATAAAAAAAAAAAGHQSAVGSLRNAGLSVITAAKMFWEGAHDIFVSIGNANASIEVTFEAIVALSDVVDSYTLGNQGFGPGQSAPVALVLSLDIVVERAVYELIEKSPLLAFASNKLAVTGAQNLQPVSHDRSAGSELDTGGVSDEAVTEVESSEKATTETTAAVTEVSEKEAVNVAVDKEDTASLPVDIGNLSLALPAESLLSSSFPESAPKVPTEHSPLALLATLDDCIAVLVYVVLPVLDKRGLTEDLRTPRLLRELQEYRALVGEYSAGPRTNIPRPSLDWQGTFFHSDSHECAFNDQFEREIALNDLWYGGDSSDLAHPSPFAPLSPLNCTDLLSTEWGVGGDIFMKSLALTQVPTSGWSDVIEHMRFRLEMLLDEVEPGSAVTLQGSSCLCVCDRNGEVDILVKVQSLSDKTALLASQRVELKKKILALVPENCAGILAAQFVLGKIQDCVSTARGTVLEHIEKLKKRTIEARILSKLNADSDLICKIGDRISETSQKNLDIQKYENAQFSGSAAVSKSLKVALSACETNIAVAKSTATNMLRAKLPNIGYNILKPHEQYGLCVLRCVDEDAPEGPTPCTVTLDTHTESARQQSALLRTYMNLDSTHKVKHFITVLRSLVREQGVVGDATGKEESNPSGQRVKAGCLSTYAWTVLAVHVLLHFQLLPNVHSQILGNASKEGPAVQFSAENVPFDLMSGSPPTVDVQKRALFNRIMTTRGELSGVPDGYEDESILTGKSESAAHTTAPTTDNEIEMKTGEKADARSDVAVTDISPVSYAERLNGISILDLLHLFLGYLSGAVDVFGTTLTLRGEGELIPKVTLKDGTVPVAQWHLSVEDPILPLTCSTPVDLGKSLTMHGQLQVFRVLRRAHCGTRALLTANPTEAVQGALLLFDRQGLIKLSLNGGYESEIRPTPTWRFTFNLRLLHDKAADRGPTFAPERSASNDSGSAASTSSGSCISVSPQSAPTPDSYYAHQSLSQQHAMYNQQQQQFRQGQGQGGFLPTRPSPDQQQLQQQRYAQQQQLQQQQQAYGLHGVPGLALGGQSGASRTSSNGLGQGQGQNGLYAGYQGQQQLGGKGAPHHPGTQTQIQNQGPGQTSGQGQGQGPTSAGKYGALLNGRMGQQQQQQQQQRQSFETQPSANNTMRPFIPKIHIASIQPPSQAQQTPLQLNYKFDQAMGAPGDWQNSGQNNFDFANAQVTDRSEISTDRSDYNGSIGYFEGDGQGQGQGQGSMLNEHSPRGFGGQGSGIFGSGERGAHNGSTSPRTRLMPWSGEGSTGGGGVERGAPSFDSINTPGLLGAQAQGGVVFGSRFQPQGGDLGSLSGTFGDRDGSLGEHDN